MTAKTCSTCRRASGPVSLRWSGGAVRRRPIRWMWRSRPSTGRGCLSTSTRCWPMRRSTSSPAPP
uniref:Uncharacterized protein n=1 Tax=uncultured bacterium 9F08 TaxID=697051 RepID=D2XIR8_9BACT|nr:hypothetical protein [uncultured bacterium 9F08]